MKKLLTIAFVLFFAITLVNAQGSAFSADTEKENVVKIYPNPATSEVQIEIVNSTLIAPSISIHSIIGNKINVQLDRIKPNIFKVEIDNLPPGYYLVVIKEKDFNKTFKFLKR